MLAFEDGEEGASLRSRRRQQSDGAGSALENGAFAHDGPVRYAGIDLELTGDASACDRVRRAARAGMLTEAASVEALAQPGADTFAPKFAASCRLQMVPPPAVGAALSWSWTDDAGELSTRLGGASVRTAPGGFEGRAWVADEAPAPLHLLGGLALMLSHRLGGTVLHAASIELNGGVVAFMGPSGAGKSTACRHVEGARLVSVDRLAVVPLGGRWFSHALPGGTLPAFDIPGAPHRWRPLAAILRVRQSAGATTIVEPSAALAVTLLRESTFQSGLRPSAERELLALLEGLVRHVPVAQLELRLGASLKPLLRRWLESQAKDR